MVGEATAVACVVLMSRAELNLPRGGIAVVLPPDGGRSCSVSCLVITTTTGSAL
jgi:hypothetical protein